MVKVENGPIESLAQLAQRIEDVALSASWNPENIVETFNESIAAVTSFPVDACLGLLISEVERREQMSVELIGGVGGTGVGPFLVRQKNSRDFLRAYQEQMVESAS